MRCAMRYEKHERKILEIINLYRIVEKLEPILFDSNIALIARQHSRDMAEEVVAFGRDGFKERAAHLSKYPREHVSENIAYYKGLPMNEDIVVQFWLKSKKHRDIIRGDFNRTGIGIAKDAGDTFYITQLFTVSNKGGEGS